MTANNGKRPVTQDDYDQVAALHAQGLGRNAIARETGRAQRTVSVICAELGLTFDTTMAEAATRARVTQLAEKRALLADALTDDALRLTEQVWQPAIVYSFGGKDNTYEHRVLDEPPAGDKRALMGAAGMAIDRSLRLVPPADDTGAEAARSMLGALADGIRRITTEGDGEDGTGEG